MSLIYKSTAGGELHQVGAKEIPYVLERKKISLIILSAQEYQPEQIPKIETKFLLADKIYVPLRDTILFTPKEYKNTIEQAKQVADVASNYVLHGKNVISSCWAGLNRSGLISGFIIHNLSGQPGKNIVRNIRNKRHWRALSNPLFAREIAKLN